MSILGGRLDKLARTRLALLAVALALTLIGILFVHSTTRLSLTGECEPFPSVGARGQITKALVALLAFAAVTRIGYRVLERFAYIIFGGLCLVLTGMIILKITAGGAKSFIQLRLFQVQPSELMKVALVLALAKYLRFREDQRTLPGLVGPLLLMLVPMGLVLLQPDLGTSLMFPPMLVAVLYVAGSKPKHLLVAVLVGVLSLPAAYFLGDKVPFMQGYQRARITSFFRRDPLTERTEGMHLHHSIVALGSGGLAGKGLGEGTQNTLGHLYEKKTDFIYGVIGEEWGFAGAGAVAALFCLFLWLGLRVALLTREPFGRLAVTGVAVGLAAQSLENIGMTMGLTPITGVPLPFVSHGGSSLVTSYLALAVAFTVAGERVRVLASKDLDPEDVPETLPVLDHRPAGQLQHRWPME